MGGIVVKQVCSNACPIRLSRPDSVEAIVTAYEDPRFNDIFHASRAIMFMGTPHRGSAIANTAVNLATIANFRQKVPGLSFLVKPIRTDLLKVLIRDSPILDDIDNSFRHRIGNITIMSCYETVRIEILQKLASFSLSSWGWSSGC